MLFSRQVLLLLTAAAIFAGTSVAGQSLEKAWVNMTDASVEKLGEFAVRMYNLSPFRETNKLVFCMVGQAQQAEGDPTTIFLFVLAIETGIPGEPFRAAEVTVKRQPNGTKSLLSFWPYPPGMLVPTVKKSLVPCIHTKKNN
ncbi:hypothetical protein AXF42_Ash020250 [Apostasia shenzhenica]|uniref:Cystatin domain-containing protein n=1 Tax=Apostasia shenzhenica TaxID=1088818 RepID=A0A2I0AVU4_9ASPA|nr:hypothetical protein AXF42_Ash020250 [Apostasia shenzhenica]